MDATFNYGLADILDFTAEDLQANRRGQLTGRQQVILRRRGRAANEPHEAYMALGLVAGLALIAVGIFGGDARTSQGLVGWGVAALLLALVMYGRAKLKNNAVQVDIHEGKVRAARVVWVEGPSRPSLVPRPRFAYHHPRFIYRLYIDDGQAFAIDIALFSALQPNAHYTIYYAPHSRVILSAERLE